MTNNSYFKNTRYDAISLLKNSGHKKILEIGGGEFTTLEYLKSLHDAEAWGIDPYYNDRRIDRGMNIITGYIDKKNDRDLLPSNYFDLIIANDVLEHIEDTDMFFRTCNELLVSEGALLLSVPNVRQIRALWNIFVMGEFPRLDSGLFDRTHLRWFCRRDVEMFAYKFGFSIVDHIYKGRYVLPFINKVRINEFLALQNIFLLEKK